MIVVQMLKTLHVIVPRKLKLQFVRVSKKMHKLQTISVQREFHILSHNVDNVYIICEDEHYTVFSFQDKITIFHQYSGT